MRSGRSGRGVATGGLRSLLLARIGRVLLLFILVAGCSSCSPPPSFTPAPTAPPILRDDAGPRDLLEVFLKTLVIGDCAAARKLSTPSGFAQVGGFCQRIHVVDFTILGDGASVGPDEVTFATELAIERGDDSLPAGDHTIFFSLERQPGGPWRVTGGGTGP